MHARDVSRLLYGAIMNSNWPIVVLTITWAFYGAKFIWAFYNVQYSIRSSLFTSSLVASLYSCRQKHIVICFWQTWGSLSSSSTNISLYCSQYATTKEENTKNDKSRSDCLFGPITLEISPTRTARTFSLAVMLFCTWFWTSSDSKVSGFHRPHVSEKYRIQNFPFWRADSKVSGFASRIYQDACGRKGGLRKEKYTELKVTSDSRK